MNMFDDKTNDGHAGEVEDHSEEEVQMVWTGDESEVNHGRHYLVG